MVAEETGLPSSFHPGDRLRRNSRITFDAGTATNVRWIRQLGSNTYTSPVVADGRLFIGTNDDALEDGRIFPTEGGLLLCLAEDDGHLIWQLAIPKLDVDRALVSRDFDALNLGICSTPTVDGNRLYIVTNRCELLCLDVAGMTDGNDGPYKNEAIYSSSGSIVELSDHDADIVWRFDMLREIPNFPHDASNSCPLVHGDFVYVGTSNGVSYERVMRPEAPALVVFDKRTGELVARDNTMISVETLHGQWSSPSLGRIGGHELILFGGGDGRCYAFQPLTMRLEGRRFLTELWRFDANPSRYRELCPTVHDYWTAAKAGRKGQLADGPLITPSEIIGTPVLHNGKVYVAVGQDPMHGSGPGALSCYDATLQGDITETGRLWQYTDIGRTMATVSIANGLLFIAETEGKVHCLDPETGAFHWMRELSDDAWGSTLVADGKVFVGTRRGIVILSADREGKQLGAIDLSSRVATQPAVANGTLFIASRRNLFAVATEPNETQQNADAGGN